MHIYFFPLGLKITWGRLVMSELGPGHRECLGGLHVLSIGWRTDGVALGGIWTRGGASREVRPDELTACVPSRPEPARFLGVFEYEGPYLLAPGWSLAKGS